MVLAAEKMNTKRITVTDLLPIVGFECMIHCEIIKKDWKFLWYINYEELKIIWPIFVETMPVMKKESVR